MFISVFMGSAAIATTDPWYSVENIDKLEINLHFKGASLDIKGVYHFHMGLFGEILKANPQLGLVISHGNKSPYSRVRSEKVLRYFASREALPMKRVFVKDDLSVRYVVAGGERILIRLRKLEDVVPKKVKKVKAPIVIESDEYVVDPEGELQNRREGICQKLDVFLGVGAEVFTFTDQGDFLAYSFWSDLDCRVSKGISLNADLSFVQPDAIGDAKLEYDFKIGFDTHLSIVHLDSRLYHKKNFIWIAPTSQFEMITDYGLSQRVGLGLIRDDQRELEIGFAGDISLSNNFSAIDSANIYSYTTDLRFVFRKFSMSATFYVTKRKYKSAGVTYGADIFGLSFGRLF